MADAQITCYVAQAGQTPAAPYMNWTTAASNIQDAVDAAASGDTVLVSNGVYNSGGAVYPDTDVTNLVCITNPITVRSVNGPDVTLIDGSGLYRCVYMEDGTVFSGFTLTNGNVTAQHGMDDRNLVAGGLLFCSIAEVLTNSAIVTNCVITHNACGGIFLHNGDARVLNCTIKNNNGGSQYFGGIGLHNLGEYGQHLMAACRITDNTGLLGGGVSCMGGGGGAGGGGGISEKVSVLNCYIAGNTAYISGGTDGGGVNALGFVHIRNCAIINNQANGVGGGLKASGWGSEGDMLVVNTIIYHNTAPTDANVNYEDSTTTFSNCCTFPQIDGDNIITNEPLMLGIANPHIAVASPCRSAGATNGIPATEKDIDGETRVYAELVDIGCDQVILTNLTGALSSAIEKTSDSVLVGRPLIFTSALQGKAHEYIWSVATNGGTAFATNALWITASWDTTGQYNVVLSASNLDVSGSATVTVQVVNYFTNFVSSTGLNVSPYTNWADAATNLQDAIDQCAIGGTVLVETGLYHTAGINLHRGITVRGFRGFTNTVFSGDGNNRCFILENSDAMLANITVSNGYAEEGAGIWLKMGIVSNCAVVNNHATIQGGGIKAESNSVITECRIDNNRAEHWGGGLFAIHSAATRNCLIRGNDAASYGGGAYLFDDDALLQDCFISSNTSWNGAGVHLRPGRVVNCTVVHNLCYGYGGGILVDYSPSVILNSIVYHNQAMHSPVNLGVFAADLTVQNSCVFPAIEGTGNITNEPVLLGYDNPHIIASSPCINAGTNSLDIGLTDIDGEVRVYNGQVDIGCDEHIATNILGALTVNIIAETNVVVNDAADIEADINGKAIGYRWRVATEGGGTTDILDTFQIKPVWTQAGDYAVSLAASNLETSAAFTVNVHVVFGGFTNYVTHNGTHIAPFTNWATAATNLQAAVDACYVGGVVMVATGIYYEANTVLIERRITVMGTADRGQTVIDGRATQRVFTLNHKDAVLSGLTICNGDDRDAGGVFMFAGAVSNCVISNNYSAVNCGGIVCAGQSLVTDSLICNNRADNYGPAGVWCVDAARVYNSTISGNSARYGANAGGAYCESGGTIDRCLIVANDSTRGGGVYLFYGGYVLNSTIISNYADNAAGVFLYNGGTVSNCDIESNISGQNGGGVWFYKNGLVVNSRINQNAAPIDGVTLDGIGGGALLQDGGELRNCVVLSNSARHAAGVHMQNGGLTRECEIGWNRARTLTTTPSACGGVYNYNSELRNCLIHANSSGDDAGGVGLADYGDINNCTIFGNSANGAGGGLHIESFGNVRNCIIYGNTAASYSNYYAPDDDDYFTYCCAAPLPEGGTNNIAVDPQLNNPAGYDFRLGWDSPCVDAGMDIWATPDVDLAGNPRLAGAHVDMGCYEMQARDHILPASRVGRTSFQANWRPVSLATNYFFDLAYDNGFTSYVSGYQNLKIGNVSNLFVTGLAEITPFYCRVRAQTMYGVAVNSKVTNATTAVTPTNLPTPRITSATYGTHTNMIRVTWSGVEGATSYDVLRNTTNNAGGATLLANVPAGVGGQMTDAGRRTPDRNANRSTLSAPRSTFFYDDYAVVPRQSYYYWVRALSESDVSILSYVGMGYAELGSGQTVGRSDLTIYDLVFLPVNLTNCSAAGTVSYRLANGGPDALSAAPVRFDFYMVQDGQEAWLTSTESNMTLAAGAEKLIIMDAAMRSTLRVRADLAGRYTVQGRARHTGLIGDGRTGSNTTDAAGAVLVRAAGVNSIGRGLNDYDGDGKADLALCADDMSACLLATSGSRYEDIVQVHPGQTNWVAVPGDYEGAGKTGVGVYVPVYGLWNAWFSSDGGHLENCVLGGSEFGAVQADYDGDRRTDPAVYRERDGSWQIAFSSLDYALGHASLGGAGYQPVIADYDGDGKADLAVYEPATGLWMIGLSGGGYQVMSGYFGSPAYLPAPADYDGDGLADPAIYLPASGYWQILQSGSLATSGAYTWWGGWAGNANGWPVPSDYDGDGKADLAVYHQSGLWEIFLSACGYQQLSGYFGGAGYQPVLE